MPRKKKSEEVVENVSETVEETVAKKPRKTTKKVVEEVGEEVKKPAKRTTKKKVENEETTEVKEKKPRKTSKKALEAQTTTEEVVVKPKRKYTRKAKVVEEVKANEEVEKIVAEIMDMPIDNSTNPRRSIAFIGSECHPFVKTGGLGDVMYALPRSLKDLNCDVRVILPRYQCIPEKYQQAMVYKGEFYMDLGETGRNVYVGIMEYVMDGVVYDFIDNQEFFSGKKPYNSIVDDIPKYCLFSKAALAALNFLNWIPDIVHCHDWQAALIPVYLKTLFQFTPVGRAKSVITIHNLRFQGIYNLDTIKYWSGIPGHAFNYDVLKVGDNDANMLKGGIACADKITTVSNTYALEIQTQEYGEGLEGHLQHHHNRLKGIVNGIDVEMWNPATDPSVVVNYDLGNVLNNKHQNKTALQQELGLQVDDSKFVIGLISRLTDQKGLDLVNAIIPAIMDEHTQIVVLGTGDKVYEQAFSDYEQQYKGRFVACIQYDEARAHRIYAAADALLVPSRFEPCGLTQLNAMHYGTVPIVRETGGLKDTVEPYNSQYNSGNGFTFVQYDAGLLYDAINRAKTLFFTNRWCWDEMVQRDMAKDVSWENSAKQYKELYLDLTKW